VTLCVGKDMHAYFLAHKEKSHISRSTDIYMSPAEVVKWVNSIPGELDLWWVHVNSHKDPEANGAEIFVSQSNTEEDDRLKKLLASFCVKYGLRNRGLKRRKQENSNLDHYWIHRSTPKRCKSKLLELAFISNEKDRNILKKNVDNIGPYLGGLILGKPQATPQVTLLDINEKLDIILEKLDIIDNRLK